MEEETKVFAIQSIEKGHAVIFGEGVLLGDLAPETYYILGKPSTQQEIKERVESRGGTYVPLTNPCIRLDSGELVWGFECYWKRGTRKDFCKKYTWETEEVVKPLNIQIQDN